MNFFIGDDFVKEVIADREIALANVHGHEESLKYLPFNPDVQPRLELQLGEDFIFSTEQNKQTVKNFLNFTPEDFKIDLRRGTELIEPGKWYTGLKYTFLIKCVLLDFMAPESAIYRRYVKGEDGTHEAETAAFLKMLDNIFGKGDDSTKDTYYVTCRLTNGDLHFKCNIPESFLLEHGIAVSYPECIGAASPEKYMNDQQFARWVVSAYYCNYCNWDRVHLRCDPELREDVRRNWMNISDMALD